LWIDILKSLVRGFLWYWEQSVIFWGLFHTWSSAPISIFSSKCRAETFVRERYWYYFVGLISLCWNTKIVVTFKWPWWRTRDVCKFRILSACGIVPNACSVLPYFKTTYTVPSI